ncbi:TauD/TfdA family dioxygenase [Bradyrhizobium ganzhouense]|uniref:TauD/TfdA family dioxygenase n=1 Tax=Bradyrhizobium ganzhouense TaxID=1179767 RepID=UPI003CF4246F
MSIDVSQLEANGFIFARGVQETDLLDFVQALGNLRVDPRSPIPVRDIRPQPPNAAKANTLSSRYGTDAFPFHTDTAHWDQPARYLVLFCVDPGEGQRETLLQDSRAWQLEDDEVELACRALWKTGHVRPRLCMLAQRSADGIAVRYDRDCMRPMTREARELEALVEQRIDGSEKTRVSWEPECLLIIDNRRMVHARGPSKRPDANRVLKRILIGGG